MTTPDLVMASWLPVWQGGHPIDGDYCNAENIITLLNALHDALAERDKLKAGLAKNLDNLRQVQAEYLKIREIALRPIPPIILESP